MPAHQSLKVMSLRIYFKANGYIMMNTSIQILPPNDDPNIYLFEKKVIEFDGDKLLFTDSVYYVSLLSAVDTSIIKWAVSGELSIIAYNTDDKSETCYPNNANLVFNNGIDIGSIDIDDELYYEYINLLSNGDAADHFIISNEAGDSIAFVDCMSSGKFARLD
jgi:hypothetical protein